MQAFLFFCFFLFSLDRRNLWAIYSETFLEEIVEAGDKIF